MSRLQRRPSGPTRPIITFFASGLAETEQDFRGAWAAHVPVGIIAAAKTGKSVVYKDRPRDWIRAYVQAGGKLFCDSGAFTVAFTGKVLDFHKVFAYYQQLVAISPAPQNLTLVMPDSVAQQDVTVALWQQYAKQIRAFAAATDAIMPLQKGAMSLSQMYLLARAATGLANPGVGIPMKKDATKVSELLAFVRESKPTRVHLLGMGLKQKSIELAAEIMAIVPTCVITGDAVESTTDFGEKDAYRPAWLEERLAQRALARKGDRWVFQPSDRRTVTLEQELDFLLPLPKREADLEQFNEAVQEMLADMHGLPAAKLQAIHQLTGGNLDRIYSTPQIARQVAQIVYDITPMGRVDFMATHFLGRRRKMPVPKVAAAAPAVAPKPTRKVPAAKPRRVARKACRTGALPGGKRQVGFKNGRCVVFHKRGTAAWRKGRMAKVANGRRMACRNFQRGC